MMDNNEATPELAPKTLMGRADRERHDVTRIVFQILSIAVLIGAVVWILRPFLISIVWAGMIVVTTWPAFLMLQARLKNKRGLAVAVMTLALLLVVVVPLLSAVGAFIQKAPDIYVWLKSLSTFTIPPPPKWLGTIPLAGQKLTDLWQQATTLGMKGLGTYLAPYAMKAATWFVSQAGTLGVLAIQFLLTVLIAAILYARGETVSAGVRRFARRLAGQQGETVTILAGKAIRGVALGVVVTALVQAIVAGLGLVITGVPVAVLLTGVVFVFCLAQIGPALVLIPVVIWLYWQHGVFWGSTMVVFSVLSMGLDNIVRPILIKKGADLPLVLIIAGVIGGLIAFGIIGLFIGPVILAVAQTLLQAWVTEGEAGEDVDSEGTDKM
jgi:predicted PurR-regulated permease PerM